MAIPNVNFTILDNALGAVSPSPSHRVLVIGPSQSGSNNTPGKFVSIKALKDAYGLGRGPELAAGIIAAGGEVVFVRAAASTAPSVLVADAAHTFTGTGTSVIDATGTALDDYDFLMTVTTGGTIGVAGIKLTVSCDGGLTNGGTVSLGTASTYLIPNTGVTLTFAAGTLVAGDTDSFSVRAATCSSSDITDALTAFTSSNHTAGFGAIASPIDDSIGDALQSALETAATNKRFMSLLTYTRLPNIGESRATWLASSAITAFSDEVYDRMVVAGGGERVISVLTGRQMWRPSIWPVAARAAIQPISEDMAWVGRGPIGGTILDSSNNLRSDCYDERISGALDGERFMTLRTIVGFPGVYVTNPNVLAGPGSDFGLWQNRRVMDEACRITNEVLTKRLSQAVRVDKVTGFILEADAAAYESAVNSALRNGLVAPGDASDAVCTVSRTDDILATKTLTAEVRVLPKGYTKFINVTMGFTNPAQAVAVAAQTATV